MNRQRKEPNLYIWYINVARMFPKGEYKSATKKFYLGKSNGNTAYYTHSSTDEEFCAIVPSSLKPIKERKKFWEDYNSGKMKGIRYRKLPKRIVLVDVTDNQKSSERENVLLKNRKRKKWGKYYNIHTGDPRFVDQSGENNSNYKHGKLTGAGNNPEIRRRYLKKYRESPEGKAAQKKYRESLKGKAYRESLKGKAAQKKAQKKYKESLKGKAAQKKMIAKNIAETGYADRRSAPDGSRASKRSGGLRDVQKMKNQRNISSLEDFMV